MSGSITRVLVEQGVYAVFVLMLVDAVLPAASELVMLYGGAIASGAIAAGTIHLFGVEIPNGLPAYLAVSASGTIGYAIGSWIGWLIGVRGGRPLLERHARLLHLTPRRLSQAERWFARYGPWAVLLGRVTPVVRSFISIPAGVFGVPLRRYLVLTFLGSAVWAFALAGAGWASGASYGRVEHNLRLLDVPIAAALLIGAALVLRSVRRQRSP